MKNTPLPANLIRAARVAAARYYDGEISSADASREFQRIANSGWHGEPYEALMTEFDAAVSRLIDTETAKDTLPMNTAPLQVGDQVTVDMSNGRTHSGQITGTYADGRTFAILIDGFRYPVVLPSRYVRRADTPFPIGTRVLLPNYEGQTFVYGRVLETEGPNVKVALERRTVRDAAAFWTTASRLVLARKQ